MNKAVNSLRFYLSKKNVILITSTKQRHLYKNHLREINYENYQYCCCCYGSFNSVIWRVRGGTGYSITSATNNNKLSGTAVIYK